MKKTSFGIFTILLIFAFLLGIYYKIGNFLPAVSKPEIREPTKEIIYPPQPNELNSRLHPPEGFNIGYFAKNIPGVRDLQMSPGNILLASLTKEGRVVALPDTNRDGVANQIITLLHSLNNPHGLAFYQKYFFVAEEGQVNRYHWQESPPKAVFDKTIVKLPPGGRHFTRSLVFNPQGQLFISIGSTCDACFEEDSWHVSVIQTDFNGRDPHVLATGLRNSVFITRQPSTNLLWATEMGRDFLGDDLPPDEINIIRRGNYGWPICYGNRVYDQNFSQKNPEYCQKTIAPVYEIKAHSAPLGLTFINEPTWPKSWQGDLLVAYHGSWNSTQVIGYKIVRLIVNDNNKVIGEKDFLTGFLDNNFDSFGRPVDLEFNEHSDLYISDDKQGVIYILTRKS